jgi:hypothetical protein
MRMTKDEEPIQFSYSPGASCSVRKCQQVPVTQFGVRSAECGVGNFGFRITGLGARSAE